MPVFVLNEIQQKMMAILKDRSRHTKVELHSCLSDEFASIETVKYHVSCIRRTLVNQELICELYGGKTYYRLVDLGATNVKRK